MLIHASLLTLKSNDDKRLPLTSFSNMASKIADRCSSSHDRNNALLAKAFSRAHMVL